MHAPYPLPNPAPGGVSVAATVLADCPVRGPYLGYWAPGTGFLAAQWFNMM